MPLAVLPLLPPEAPLWFELLLPLLLLGASPQVLLLLLELLLLLLLELPVPLLLWLRSCSPAPPRLGASGVAPGVTGG